MRNMFIDKCVYLYYTNLERKKERKKSERERERKREIEIDR
jgi:hypothetical protein